MRNMEGVKNVDDEDGFYLIPHGYVNRWLIQQ
jgi:hypothetical protein